MFFPMKGFPVTLSQNWHSLYKQTMPPQTAKKNIIILPLCVTFRNFCTFKRLCEKRPPPQNTMGPGSLKKLPGNPSPRRLKWTMTTVPSATWSLSGIIFRWGERGVVGGSSPKKWRVENIIGKNIEKRWENPWDGEESTHILCYTLYSGYLSGIFLF